MLTPLLVAITTVRAILLTLLARLWTLGFGFRLRLLPGLRRLLLLGLTAFGLLLSLLASGLLCLRPLSSFGGLRLRLLALLGALSLLPLRRFRTWALGGLALLAFRPRPLPHLVLAALSLLARLLSTLGLLIALRALRSLRRGLALRAGRLAL